jgi:hypothetical protein
MQLDDLEPEIMIYEFRTYTMKPGTAPKAAAHAGSAGRDIRGDHYGKLEGYWMTEVGPLNQVMHLWSYSDLNERARLRTEMLANKRWSNEYVPLLRTFLLRQDIRLLNGIVGFWSTEAGQPNEVCHIWAYPSFEARGKIRGQVADDPDWRGFLGKSSDLIEEMHSTLMLPAKHSPLK